MQNKPFIRIDNRLVMDSPKPSDDYPRGDEAVWEHDTMLKMKAAIREWERRPSYPINPADLDKFEFGKQYWENVHFKKKKVHVDADGNEAIVYTVGWKYFAFPLHTPNDRREDDEFDLGKWKEINKEAAIGFEIKVLENSFLQKGTGILSLHPDDYKNYCDRLTNKK